MHLAKSAEWAGEGLKKPLEAAGSAPSSAPSLSPNMFPNWEASRPQPPVRVMPDGAGTMCCSGNCMLGEELRTLSALLDSRRGAALCSVAELLRLSSDSGDSMPGRPMPLNACSKQPGWLPGWQLAGTLHVLLLQRSAMLLLGQKLCQACRSCTLRNGLLTSGKSASLPLDAAALATK